ncbi:N(alpha)-acetyltransferase 20 [Binucleata daphniae]
MKMGYIVYRTILNYYESPQEDAFEMRKALKYDLYKPSISKPNPSTINASDLE